LRSSIATGGARVGCHGIGGIAAGGRQDSQQKAEDRRATAVLDQHH
jgi:hypothetical protein